MSEDELLAALRVRIELTAPLKLRPPATKDELARFERVAGVKMPALMERVYSEIGDGGWGPGYGLCPLGVRGDEDEPWFSVLAQWQSDQEGKATGTPQTRLYFCDGGCSVFSFLDIHTDKIGSADGIDFLHWEADSLHSWFSLWLDGKPMSSTL